MGGRRKMIKNLYKEGLVLVIACLFFAIGAIPNICSDDWKLNTVKAINTRDLSDLSIHTQTSLAHWTVMYYLCGDSHLCDETGPLLENLSKIGSTDNLNIVALRDNNKLGDSRLFYISNSGEKIVLNEQFGWPDEIDTSDPNTLKLFCKQIMDAYPANYYWLVIFAAGGAGWQAFTLHDMNGDYEMPSTPKFADILEDITDHGKEKIDVLATPCITGMIEVAHEFIPYVDYLTTTEEHTPDGPRHYQRFYKAVWDLRNKTSMKPEEFSSMIPIRHEPFNFSFFTGKESRLTKILNQLRHSKLHTISMHTTSSAVNLSRIDTLTNSVDYLASLLILNIKDVNDAIKNVRSEVREYGKGYPKYLSSNRIIKMLQHKIHEKFPLEISSYDCYIDLYNFAELLSIKVDNPEIKNACDLVMENLNASIVAEKSLSFDSSHGLSIYFPDNKILYNRYIFGGKTPSSYEDLSFSQDTQWDEFLKEFLDVKP